MKINTYPEQVTKEEAIERGFNAWAKDVNSFSTELISEIKEYLEKEYRKKKSNPNQLKDEDALYVLRWETTSLLLDLMNAMMINVTKKNTNDFIDSFPFKDLPTYGIEHLLGLSRRDNVGEFVAEAERIFFNEKQSMTKTMVRRIARNFMVNSKHIKSADTQRLNSKLFDEGLQRDLLLIERDRNKKKHK